MSAASASGPARWSPRLQETLGPEYVDEKLRDLVGGQAGSMLAFLASAP